MSSLKIYPKKIIFALVCVINLAGFSTLANAANFYVQDVTTSDANPALARSLKELINSAVNSAGGEVVETEVGADYTLKSDLVKLGGAYVLTVTRMKKNVREYASRQKANSVEDLDDAADKAVRAAILGKPTKQDLRVGEVKARDENQIRTRILSRGATYLGFGPAGLANYGYSALAYNLALGYIWETTSRAQIKIMGNGVLSGDGKNYFADAVFGLNYFFSDQDAAPYVGAGLGFGFTGGSNVTSIGGFAGSLGLGYEFFRTSSTQFDIYVGYDATFGNNTVGIPGFYGGRIGILF